MATAKADSTAEEQRAYCKIRGLLGFSATEIKADLDKVYGTTALSFHVVARWVRLFKAGRENVKDDPRPGRPLSAISQNDITTIQTLIKEDARYTVDELATLSGINSSAVFTILKERLMLKKVCARWVPHILSDEQKRDRVMKSTELLRMYKDCDPRRLREIVTGDETWVYFFEPENKENNKVWIGESDERPQIARRSRTVRRVMYALFFDSDGIVARVPVPAGSTVTGTFYKEKVLSAVVQHYVTKRPQTGVRGVHLLHDNAPAHRSVIVQTYLKDNHIQVLPHPPYSPDLAPCDFWLNPLIKKYMRGRRFESRSAVGSALFQCVNSIPKIEYKNAFQEWLKRLEKCIQHKGEYFEGLT